MKLNLALVQHRAYDVEHAADGLEAVLSMLEEAALSGTDLVVLPECSYPGYYLGLSGDPVKAVEHWEDALKAFRDSARKRRFNLVAGIAEQDAGRLYNSAYLIDRGGRVAGRTRKTFLWHFDSKWFSPGDGYEVFETEIGRIGMIVCADGRLPEVSRILALKGAQIIVDPTNWVTTGRDPASLSNPQVEYIMPVRAAENGVWLACANKVGREAETMVYCGRSIVVSPTGEIVEEASPDREEILTASIELDENTREAAMRERREYYSPHYSLLTSDNRDTPLAKLLEEPVVPGRSTVPIAVVQMDRDASLQDFLQSGAALISRLAQQGADLVIFPQIPCSVYREFASPIGDSFRPLAAMLGIYVAVASYARPHNVTTVFDPRGNVLTYAGPGDDLLDVGGLRVGFLRGREAMVPENVRLLFLQGADLMVWQADQNTGMERKFCMTRALENRVYVALANCASKTSKRNSTIISPDGRILAETFPGVKQGVMAQLSPAASRVKQVVRGTDVFRNRAPHLYEALVR